MILSQTSVTLPGLAKSKLWVEFTTEEAYTDYVKDNETRIEWNKPKKVWIFALQQKRGCF
jgi:hypothetical protein